MLAKLVVVESRPQEAAEWLLLTSEGMTVAMNESGRPVDGCWMENKNDGIRSDRTRYYISEQVPMMPCEGE